MRKRKSVDEDEGSEMEIDEEKVEFNEEEDDSEEEDEVVERPTGGPAVVENPFLDSFYSLSSENPKERSKAAQVMLQHCLLSSESNAEDAAYAFRRLLNGICSGRSCARQGNASALASFLKLSFHLNKMKEVQVQQTRTEEKNEDSLFSFVRERLISVTSPDKTTGKRKGAEERDYYFGRLFGILAIVRSGILVNYEESGHSLEQVSHEACLLANDLADLFWHKRWMREPASHGIATMLKLFYDSKAQDGMSDVASTVVNTVIIPRLLSQGSDGTELPEGDSVVSFFCAEQLGVALYVQAQSIGHEVNLEFPLNKTILSEETVPDIAQALSETSSVVQPRTHFVWDTIWAFLSKPVASEANKKQLKGVVRRELREDGLIGGGSPKGVLTQIARKVVCDKLIGGGSKMTHERGALALTIVKILAGAPFMSSISGPSQIVLGAGFLEDVVMAPDIVRTLFIDVISAGNEKKKTSHLLRPLAVDVLEVITAASSESVSKENSERKLALARAFLNADVRFDAKTKTPAVAGLLELTKSISKEQLDERFASWTQFIDYLQSNLLSTSTTQGDVSSLATGYAEMIYSCVKMILRVEVEDTVDNESLREKQLALANRALRLFMTLAFFNCEEVTIKKKKRKSTSSKEEESSLNDIALAVKKVYQDGSGVEHKTRSVISFRFFSLLADFCGLAAHQVAADSSNTTTKDSMTLNILSGLCDSWKALERLGGKRFDKPDVNEDDDAVDPDEVLSAIDDLLKSASEEGQASENILSEARKRCVTGIAVLTYSLYLHRLACGSDGDESDDLDSDEDNDEEAICDAMDGLKDIASDFLQQPQDENPLLGLAETCVNLLSSPLGSGNMGRAASPKLIREAVKYSWLGGLRLSSVTNDDGASMLSNDVVNVLLAGIGADTSIAEPMDDDEGSEDESVGDDSSSDEDDDANVFQKAGSFMEDNSDSEQERPEKDDDDESDVALDSSNLKSLLEEDSDADIDENVLEHHEGADAALAKLIRLKQEARKAGQQAKEKIEMGHQLRCTFLIELLFTRPDAWAQLFEAETVMKFAVPMIRQRQGVEKSLTKSAGSGSNGEKRALLDRLTVIIRQKLCKLKLATLAPTSSPSETFLADFFSAVLTETKRASSKEQVSCCTSSVVFALRSTPDANTLLTATTKLQDAVVEWSQKRTTKLSTSLFDDIISQSPLVSQAILMMPLASALTGARSPFLKTEAFRLISSLLSLSTSSEESELGEVATKTLDSVREPFLSAVLSSLQDEEMRKSKRVKVIFKAIEKFVDKMNVTVPPSTLSLLQDLTEALSTVGESESQGVQTACAKLVASLEKKQADIQAATPTKANMEASDGKTPASKSKKSKKKKKKKR